MKIAFLGDSITEGWGASVPNEYGYVALINKKENITALNYGIGGTRIARQTNPTIGSMLFDLDYVARVDCLDPTCDYIFVFGGTNDFGHGDAKIGDKDSTSVYTFYGALKLLCQKLIDKYGKEKIRFILPIHRFDENVKNTSNYEVLKTYIDIIKEIVSMYGIEYICLDSIIPPVKTPITDLFCDGLHLTDKGYQLVADYLLNYISKLK